MPEEIEESQTTRPSIPEIIRNPPDLGDIHNKGESANWDRANRERAQNYEKQWGHAGIPPEQPTDKTNDSSE